MFGLLSGFVTMERPGIMKGKSRGHGGQRGTAMVEFALVFMLLFIVITLIAEGGFLFSTWLAATNGAREGARFGAPCLNRNVSGHPELTCYGYPWDGPPGNANVYDEVYRYTSGFLDQTPGQFGVTVDTSSPYSVTVVVKATVSSIAPILGNIPVYGQATMRLETSPQS